MYIILMRHGFAEPETDEIANKDRRLTDKGRRAAGKTAVMLRHFLKGNRLTICTSPYKRTKQTAEIAAEICGGSVFSAEELLQSAWGPVAAHCIYGTGPILLVGHQPFLQSYLMTVAGAALKFSPAAAAVISYDPKWRQGQLAGYFSPELKKLRKRWKR